jgi:hypothetical protein
LCPYRDACYEALEVFQEDKMVGGGGHDFGHPRFERSFRPVGELSMLGTLIFAFIWLLAIVGLLFGAWEFYIHGEDPAFPLFVFSLLLAGFTWFFVILVTSVVHRTRDKQSRKS